MRKEKAKEKDYEEEDEVETTTGSIYSGVVNIISSPAWFTFVSQMMMAKVDVDTDALTAEFAEEFIKHRKGDYGKLISYVPAKYIRQRLNDVLACKWSFFPIAEQRVLDPVPIYNKEKDESYDAPKYIKVLGVLAIPGLGVQAQYGVKKTYGSTESNDWKAAGTDAFKKCCSAFGIEADYEIEDVDGEDVTEVPDLEDIEYDEDELAEALETEVTFGKYKDFTLEEILDEDPDYLQWLFENAREADMRKASGIVIKHSESKKSSKSKGSKKAGSGKSSSSAKSKSSASSKSSSAKTNSSKSSSKTASSKKSSKVEDDDEEEDEDDERQELIEEIEGIFEESKDYDTVTVRELIKSITVSKKNPNGKKKLEDLTLPELKKLATVLADDSDEE